MTRLEARLAAFEGERPIPPVASHGLPVAPSHASAGAVSPIATTATPAGVRQQSASIVARNETLGAWGTIDVEHNADGAESEHENCVNAADSATARLPAARATSTGTAVSAHREAAPTAPPTTPPRAPPKAAQIADSEDTDLTATIELSLSAAGDRGAAAAARGPPAATMAEPVPLTLRSSIRSSDS